MNFVKCASVPSNAWIARRADVGFPIQTAALLVKLREQVGAALKDNIQLVLANGSTQGASLVNDF